MELGAVNLYRMTHIRNIPHILQFGITGKNSPNANTGFVTIGDISLISRRSSKRFYVDNGDLSNIGHEHIILGDYIPFYFGVKMPMLYVMQHGGNFVKKATPPEDIIYMACSLLKIITSNNIYFFTDGHATDHLTSIYNNSKINELLHVIDFNAVKAPFWGGEENLNIKRKKQAEFLVKDDIPASFIVGFVCYNTQAKQKLIDLGIAGDKIRIIPNAYF